MAANDPWTGTTWNVYGGGPDIKPSGQSGQFTLTAVANSSGATLYYKVNFTGTNMPGCWSKCHLFPRGNVPPAPISPALPPWSPSTGGQWETAADAVLGNLTVTTQRLEGDLYPGPDAQALTLLHVVNGTGSAASVLVIGLKSSGAIHPDASDGTGYGNNGG